MFIMSSFEVMFEYLIFKYIKEIVEYWISVLLFNLSIRRFSLYRTFDINLEKIHPTIQEYPVNFDPLLSLNVLIRFTRNKLMDLKRSIL